MLWLLNFGGVKMIVRIRDTLQNARLLFCNYNVNVGYVLHPCIEVWLNENCDDWRYVGRCDTYRYFAEFTFKLDTDAMAFKLRWL